MAPRISADDVTALSDPDHPLFCPGGFLLSVAMHIFATWEAVFMFEKLDALVIIHNAYRKVIDERNAKKPSG